ncbi:GNAT family N-acetyltransferase [Sneathiella sp. CAU 1612]|jgi:ribosomal protein S18 acetylase RimI-like enzyme|uniref:GNAT family N-acetyltransferase n=1 Tax=Sneathiella sedimenti TaxID=2816034 RepID=A0ABS3F2V7_9PROT|nr:GNAT family N-acetyltransferase [Sneathiella sedimenti]MBO0332849.1 GNAT family N-acetyltransferase [Sneathiella sedimenti]
MVDKTRHIQQPVIEAIKEFDPADLDDLCEAAEEAILDGNGFGWLTPPRRSVQENFWKGVLMVPVRELYCARFEGRIVGSGQLVKPFPNNEAGAHIAQVATFFIAPYARGYGLAIGLLAVIENSAREQGFKILEVDVRETQTAAISLLEANGYDKWATKTNYAWNGERYVDGYYYKKELAELKRDESLSGN